MSSEAPSEARPKAVRTAYGGSALFQRESGLGEDSAWIFGEIFTVERERGVVLEKERGFFIVFSLIFLVLSLHPNTLICSIILDFLHRNPSQIKSMVSTSVMAS